MSALTITSQLSELKNQKMPELGPATTTCASPSVGVPGVALVRHLAVIEKRVIHIPDCYDDNVRAEYPLATIDPYSRSRLVVPLLHDHRFLLRSNRTRSRQTLVIPRPVVIAVGGKLHLHRHTVQLLFREMTE